MRAEESKSLEEGVDGSGFPKLGVLAAITVLDEEFSLKDSCVNLDLAFLSRNVA